MAIKINKNIEYFYKRKELALNSILNEEQRKDKYNEITLKVKKYIKEKGYKKKRGKNKDKPVYFELIELYRRIPFIPENFKTCIIMGARNMGKTESMRRLAYQYLDKGKKFAWLRDKETTIKEVIKTETDKFVYKDTYLASNGMLFKDIETYNRYRYKQNNNKFSKLKKTQLTEIDKNKIEKDAIEEIKDDILGHYMALSTMANKRSNEKDIDIMFFDEFALSNLKGDDYVTLSQLLITNIRNKPDFHLCAVSNFINTQTNGLLRALKYPLIDIPLIHIDWITMSIIITLPEDAFSNRDSNKIEIPERFALGNKVAYMSQFGGVEFDTKKINHLMEMDLHYFKGIQKEQLKEIGVISNIMLKNKESELTDDYIPLLFCLDKYNNKENNTRFLVLDGKHYEIDEDNKIFLRNNNINFVNWTDDKKLSLNNNFNLISEKKLNNFIKAFKNKKILFQNQEIKELFLDFITNKNYEKQEKNTLIEKINNI